MKEHVSPILSRRDALRLSWQVPLSAGLGAFVGNEIVKEKKGIETKDGVFHPIYENHKIGINPEDIPDDTDVLFRELVISNGLTFSSSSAQLFEVGKNEKGQIYFSRATLNKAASKGIEIALGDTDLSANIYTREWTAGAVALIGGRALRHSRRKFLSNSLIVGGTWGLSTPISLFVDYGATLQPTGLVKRGGERLSGVVSHLHPEIQVVSFRNLMMADKLHTIAEDVKGKSGRKGRVAFLVGSAHEGIEDYLQAGHDFCRDVISLYPDAILNGIINDNGGLYDFCSVKLFSLPSNYKTEGLKGTKGKRLVDTDLLFRLNRY